MVPITGSIPYKVGSESGIKALKNRYDGATAYCVRGGG